MQVPPAYSFTQQQSNVVTITNPSPADTHYTKRKELLIANLVLGVIGPVVYFIIVSTAKKCGRFRNEDCDSPVVVWICFGPILLPLSILNIGLTAGLLSSKKLLQQRDIAISMAVFNGVNILGVLLSLLLRRGFNAAAFTTGVLIYACTSCFGLVIASKEADFRNKLILNNPIQPLMIIASPPMMGSAPSEFHVWVRKPESSPDSAVKLTLPTTASVFDIIPKAILKLSFPEMTKEGSLIVCDQMGTAVSNLYSIASLNLNQVFIVQQRNAV